MNTKDLDVIRRALRDSFAEKTKEDLEDTEKRTLRAWIVNGASNRIASLIDVATLDGDDERAVAQYDPIYADFVHEVAAASRKAAGASEARIARIVGEIDAADSAVVLTANQADWLAHGLMWVIANAANDDDAVAFHDAADAGLKAIYAHAQKVGLEMERAKDQVAWTIGRALGLSSKQIESGIHEASGGKQAKQRFAENLEEIRAVMKLFGVDPA